MLFRSEEKLVRGELLLAKRTDVWRDIAPHVCGDDDVGECVVSAELAEETEILACDTAHTGVGDAVEEYNAVELAALFVSVLTLMSVHVRTSSRLTNVTARKSVMSRRISASVLTVSSKPGVSTSVMVFPSSRKGEATCTSDVHDSRPNPTCIFELLRRLINYKILASIVCKA